MDKVTGYLLLFLICSFLLIITASQHGFIYAVFIWLLAFFLAAVVVLSVYLITKN